MVLCNLVLRRQICLILLNLLSMPNGRKQIDVIYTDFSKAFDYIDHNIIISKLNDKNLFLL